MKKKSIYIKKMREKGWKKFLQGKMAAPRQRLHRPFELSMPCAHLGLGPAACTAERPWGEAAGQLCQPPTLASPEVAGFNFCVQSQQMGTWLTPPIWLSMANAVAGFTWRVSPGTWASQGISFTYGILQTSVCCSCRYLESQNQGTAWVGMGLKDHLVPIPCHGRGCHLSGW